MDHKKYKQLRVIVSFFIALVIALAVGRDSYFLAATGVVTGMLFMMIVHTRTKIRIDEREKTIREKAAQMAYAVFAPTLAIGAFLMLMPSKSGLSVFAKGEFVYLESLGMVFAYLALFLIALYALSYHFINKKYGGSNEE